MGQITSWAGAACTHASRLHQPSRLLDALELLGGSFPGCLRVKHREWKEPYLRLVRAVVRVLSDDLAHLGLAFSTHLDLSGCESRVLEPGVDEGLLPVGQALKVLLLGEQSQTHHAGDALLVVDGLLPGQGDVPIAS